MWCKKSDFRSLKSSILLSAVFGLFLSFPSHSFAVGAGMENCARALTHIPSQIMTSPVGTWALSTLGLSQVSLVGPTYIPAPSDSVAPQNSSQQEVIYFHLLPGRAKSLRNRLSPQEVNEIFSEFLIRLTVELSQAGVTVKHQGILNEYKSIRISIAREDIHEELLDKALTEALQGFEESLKTHNPEVYALLKGSIFGRADWVEYGIGDNEYEAALASRFSEKSKRRFSDVWPELQRKLERLRKIVAHLPTQLEEVERLHLIAIEKSGDREMKSISLGLFEELRASETPDDLRDHLLKRMHPPRELQDQESASLEDLVNDLWELRGLLKDFTPPNQWDREDMGVFDAEQVARISRADRILSLDLKGAGARIFSEIYHRVQEGVLAGKDDSELLKGIKIERTVSWLKASIATSVQQVKKVLGDRYQTHVWVGDELNFYYQGETSVAEILKDILPQMRVVDLQIRSRAGESETRVLSVHTQSLIAQVGEQASKILEKHHLSRLEPIPKIAVRLELPSQDQSAPQLRIHIVGASRQDETRLQNFIENELAKIFSEAYPKTFPLFQKFKIDLIPQDREGNLNLNSSARPTSEALQEVAR